MFPPAPHLLATAKATFPILQVVLVSAIVTVLAFVRGFLGVMRTERPVLPDEGGGPPRLELELEVRRSRETGSKFQRYCKTVGLGINASVALLVGVTALGIPLLHRGAGGAIQAGCLTALFTAIFATLVSLVGAGLEVYRSGDPPADADLTAYSDGQLLVLRSASQAQANAWYRLLALRAGALLLVGLAGMSALVLLTIGQWSTH
jgi:hypothetical protein